ncbi:unnamed protein product [Ilex paraguariensis]|uniref:Cytochrome oxidase subunit II transmembrane region profile domain-containing protein n=1 Tax=Ilex paraguariensis TaxID=185542 RepID=A0ABC8S5T7_9AQUA
MEGIIPMLIAIPSFALLYSMEEVVGDPAITIKAIILFRGAQSWHFQRLHRGKSGQGESPGRTLW